MNRARLERVWRRECEQLGLDGVRNILANGEIYGDLKRSFYQEWLALEEGRENSTIQRKILTFTKWAVALAGAGLVFGLLRMFAG